jgi:phosphatidylinositol alpha-mannosyltransferase
MRITVVSFYLPPTDRIGAGVQMHMLANAYVDLGHEVTVLSPCAEKDSTARYAIETLKVVGANRILKWSLALAKHTFESDIVHFGGDDHFVRYNRSHAHIRTFHGSCFAEANVAISLKDKIRMFYLGCTELISQRQFKVNTTVSTHTNKYFLRPNAVIPNGVDLSKFVPSDLKSNSPSILFIGTLDSRKRGRQLVEAFCNTVRKDIPNAELWIVRDNTELQIPGVKVFGAVSESKLIELYQQAWVFCLPSSYEGFGVPYIESMACGTPVVATPNPGALEVLDHGRYGLITDIDHMGHALVSLLSDTRKRADLAILGLERARDFDIHKIAQTYIDLACDSVKKRVGR